MALSPGNTATVQGLAEEDMPALYKAADSSSLAGQKSFIAATKLRLLSLLTAAAAGVFSGEIGPPDWIAFIGVVAFLVALAAEVYLLVRRPERAWYEGRAAAESAKSLAWRYGVGGEPLGLVTDNAANLFLHRLEDILTDLDIEVAAGPDAGEQITPRMKNLRAADPDDRRHAYRVGRIRGPT